jgi:ATP-dependent DNA ligase
MAWFFLPRLIAQISFEEWTTDQKLRQTVFLALHDDELPEDVHMPVLGRIATRQ